MCACLLVLSSQDLGKRRCSLSNCSTREVVAGNEERRIMTLNARHHVFVARMLTWWTNVRWFDIADITSSLPASLRRYCNSEPGRCPWAHSSQMFPEAEDCHSLLGNASN